MKNYSKKEIRKTIKNILNEKSVCFARWSDIICKKLLCCQEYKDADIILSYMALPDEADLSFFMNKAFLGGKEVYIPKILADSTNMDFYEYSPIKKEFSEGAYGIQEPFEILRKFQLQQNNVNILVLVPGRAFTKDGKRLGRGKGFYDSYLERLLNKKGDLTNCKITFLGICFECQILQDLPVEIHDIKMHKIISEE